MKRCTILKFSYKILHKIFYTKIAKWVPKAKHYCMTKKRSYNFYASNIDEMKEKIISNITSFYYRVQWFKIMCNSYSQLFKIRSTNSLKHFSHFDEEDLYLHDLINCYGQVKSTLANILTLSDKDKVLKFVFYYRTEPFSLWKWKKCLKLFVECILNSCEYELHIILNHCTL